ncbi:hypothetical protein [Hymenobacter siberiensis]|uniref:hypothetical protein n=1 Tax=Hymenobacter siberiensis TaxID=2848396 RepID=UPI001C1DE8B1|nr:hypothetical protein [Hymenobacter siberiensis]MBU6122637.1 hypothetical protein [Hymenobacter siberiensis]
MPDSDFPDYAYRPDLDLFTVRWPTHELVATSRSDYEALLLLPEARRTTRWLFDVRRRPYTDATSARWVITDWLPRAAALLPAPLRLAYLVAPTRAAELAADTAIGDEVRPATLPGLPYLLRPFADEGAAVRWLLA